MVSCQGTRRDRQVIQLQIPARKKIKQQCTLQSTIVMMIRTLSNLESRVAGAHLSAGCCWATFYIQCLVLLEDDNTCYILAILTQWQQSNIVLNKAGRHCCLFLSTKVNQKIAFVADSRCDVLVCRHAAQKAFYSRTSQKFANTYYEFILPNPALFPTVLQVHCTPLATTFPKISCHMHALIVNTRQQKEKKKRIFGLSQRLQ